MARFAFEDPLTELPNRRALEERLAIAMETALREGGDVALVLCDLDGLKQTNDLLGHEAGDQRLVVMAEALRATAATRAGALPARIGGDEFCLLLEGASAPEGQRVAQELNERLGASTSSPVTVSSGVAALRLGPRSATELFRLADAAQYRAKRMGPGRVCVAGRELPLAAVRQTVRRQVRSADLDPFERLLAETVELLDTTLSGAPPLERIAAVADACARTAGAESWALSSVREGTDVLETVLSAEPDHLGGRATRRFWLPGDAYPLADYPATMAVLRDGGVLLASVDDPLTDPAERALMVEGGWEHLLAVAVRGPQTTTLVELFADAATLPLPRLAPFARALLAQAAQA